jgi:heavy metal sensor kinase
MRRYLQRFSSPGIRVQIMLWYLAVFVVLLLCSDVILYLGLKHSLEANLDTTLQLRALQLADSINYERGAIQVNTQTPDLDTTEGQQQETLWADDVNFGALVRLLDAHGRTVSVSSAFRSLIVPAVSVTRPLHGIDWQGTVTSTGGQEIRLYSTGLTRDDGTVFAVLQVGTSLNQLDTTLHSLLLQLLLMVPLLLALGAIGSYGLAARALRPIDGVTRTAQAIEVGDLHRRVPVPQTHDEIYRLTLTFNRMLERLEAAFAQQRRFVADASHELRTPLAVICNMAEITLLNAASKEDCMVALQSIVGEVERLGHLVNDLLALARADEGKTRLEHEPVRLDLLAQAVGGHLQTLAQKRQISLVVQVAEAVPVFGDEARLIQVLLNLVENALWYTEPGGKVELSAMVAHKQARLVVADTGIGIAQEHLPHIFERFYRVDPARVRTEESHSGLGLSIVNWVVRAHDGKIAVKSEVGQGSTFTLTFPLAQSPVHSTKAETSHLAETH